MTVGSQTSVDLSDDDIALTQDVINTSIYDTSIYGTGTHNWSIVDTGPSTATMTFSDDVVINRDGKPAMNLAETLEKISDRLAILEPDLEKMEKYPALKEAYENYKIVEALIANENSTD